MADKDRVLELEPIDLNIIPVTGEAIRMDLDADAWERSAPLYPDQYYKVKVFKDRIGWQIPKEKTGPNVGKNLEPTDKDFYITTGLELKVMSEDPDLDGRTILAKVGTNIWRGKDISTCLGLALKLGLKKDQKYGNLTHLQQAKLLDKLLVSEPTITVEIDWRGGYTDAGKGNNKGNWVQTHRRYQDFPVDPENTEKRKYQVEIQNKDDRSKREEINAMVFVKKWFGKGEALPAIRANKTVSTAVIELEEELTPAKEPAKEQKSGREKGKSKPQPEVDSDLELILE